MLYYNYNIASHELNKTSDLDQVLQLKPKFENALKYGANFLSRKACEGRHMKHAIICVSILCIGIENKTKIVIFLFASALAIVPNMGVSVWCTGVCWSARTCLDMRMVHSVSISWWTVSSNNIFSVIWSFRILESDFSFPDGTHSL